MRLGEINVSMRPVHNSEYGIRTKEETSANFVMRGVMFVSAPIQ